MAVDSDASRAYFLGISTLTACFNERGRMARKPLSHDELHAAMDEPCDWLQQRIAANSVSGRLDSVQVLREVMLRGLEILEGGA